MKIDVLVTTVKKHRNFTSETKKVRLVAFKMEGRSFNAVGEKTKVNRKTSRKRPIASDEKMKKLMKT